LLTQILSTLTEFELQVFDLMVSSFTYREIADMLDRDKKQIDNAIQRIKMKVKENVKDQNTVIRIKNITTNDGKELIKDVDKEINVKIEKKQNICVTVPLQEVLLKIKQR